MALAMVIMAMGMAAMDQDMDIMAAMAWPHLTMAAMSTCITLRPTMEAIMAITRIIMVIMVTIELSWDL